MNLIGISINHKTAPIDVLESLHLSREEIIKLIPSLKEEFSEGVVISTCNRTEIFCISKTQNIDSSRIIKKLLEFKPVQNVQDDNFVKYFSCGAIKHIFSVASGIDSLIIGDSQILGQVKEAFELSEGLDFAGTIIKRIFNTALKVGKRAIKETAIGEGAVTVSYAAVQVLEKIFASLEKKSALVIGAGETGELAAIHLKDKAIGKISISNRTLQRAESLAEKVNGNVIPFESLKENIHNYDIIISATSSPDFILTKTDIQEAMKRRKNAPLVLMDIAVPRDIDPEVKDIENVFYHDMDSLKVIVDKNILKRKNEIPKVEKIIMEEMIEFFSWYNTLEVVPVIKSLREFFEEIKNDELEKIKNKVTAEDYVKIEDMTRRLIGRLLHNPTVKLRELAESGINIEEMAAHTFIVKELFSLNKSKSNGNGIDQKKDKT